MQSDARQHVRGIVVRRETICIALSHRVVVFAYGVDPGFNAGVKNVKGKLKEVDGGFWLRKLGEWETTDNTAGRLCIGRS